MREALFNILRCPGCGNGSLSCEIVERDDTEVRRAKILCNNCGALYKMSDGIADFIKDPGLHVRREQEAVDSEEYLRDGDGNKYKINKANIERFREQFLTLPEGDGSYFFKKGGSFQSIKEGAHRFYSVLEDMGVEAGNRILALGDGFGYASYRFAQRGSSVVALDISSYLLAADLYIKDVYFDRVFSDMHETPFKTDSFDIVFCSAVLHHSKELKKVFSEIRRILKPDGRLFVINESSRGIFEKADELFDGLNKRGYSDTAYTIPEWLKAATSSGFKRVKLEFLSLAEDYIVRQENKSARPGISLKVAYFLRKHQWLENMALFLLKYPRILFRPKSWRMVCYK